ncbi:MAG: PA2169 family four-helix-bundle protein [Sphingobacteriaceae bacterium]|nr:MAG: PA2169 family four-helix-bundle protein [Sphingobacteriaceae bacterium]
MATTETAENQISALNKLIKINNDRAEGYKKGLEGTQDADLKTLFTGYVAQSQKNSAELEGFVKSLGGEPADSTSISGDLHHAWMDVKSTFTGKDRHSVLADCEAGEDVAKKAYKEALGDTDISWDANISSAISSQNQGILSAHNEVKALRDAAKS